MDKVSEREVRRVKEHDDEKAREGRLRRVKKI